VRNKKEMKIIVLILIILFTIGFVYAATLLDDTQAEFDSGTYANTFYNTSGFVQLNASQTSGNYTSQIFNAGAISQWNNISWTQGAYYQQELPDNCASESGLGGVDMTGTKLLMHLNEASGTIEDTSGQGNNGTYNGALYSQSGKFNTAIGFDGTDDVITVSDDDSLSFGDGATTDSPFSITAWVNMDDATSFPILDKLAEYTLDTGGSDNLFFRIYDNAVGLATAKHVQTTGTLTSYEGQWTHLAATYDGSSTAAGIKIYINGVQQATTVQNDGVSYSAMHNNGYPLTIGKRESWSTKYANGDVDELMIINKTLSANEILNIYKRGALKLNLTARSCDDAACSGESFTDITDESPQSLSVANNSYFQYKFAFETDNATYSPELYNVTIDYTSLNAIPITTTPSITPATAYTNNDLNCSFTVTDNDDGDNLSINYTWYNGSTAMITGNLSVVNGTEESIILKSGNTTKGETWNCSVIPYDGASYGTEKSASRTISNSLPTAPVINVTPDIPNDGDDLTCSVKTASTDNDNDAVTYARQWYKNSMAQAGETANTLSNTLTTPGEIWMCVVTPNDGTSDGAAGNDSVTINGTIPTYAVNLISPSNGASWTSSSTVTFQYNTTLNATNCSLIINGAVDQTDDNITVNATESFTKSLSNAAYTWSVNCTDVNNVTNSSATWTVTVSYSTGGGGGGVGGGGGGTTTTTTPVTTVILPEEEEVCSEFWICEDWSKCINGRKTRTCVDFNACGTALSRPIETETCLTEDQLALEQLNVDQYRVEQTFTVSQNNEISFSYGGETHSITITEITPEKVSVIIRSEPISVDLYPKQPQGVDLDNDGRDDIKLILNFVEDGEAEITLKFVGTGISSITGEAITVLPYKSPKSYYLVPVILLLVLFIVLVSVRKSHLSKKTKKFVTVLHIILMGLIILIFLTSFFKDSIIGAILTNATNTTAAQSSSAISKMSLPMIAFALIIAAVSIIMIFIERKKIKGLFKKKHGSRAKKKKAKKIKKIPKRVKKLKIKPRKRQKAINKLFKQKRRKRKKR